MLQWIITSKITPSKEIEKDRSTLNTAMNRCKNYYWYLSS